MGKQYFWQYAEYGPVPTIVPVFSYIYNSEHTVILEGPLLRSILAQGAATQPVYALSALTTYPRGRTRRGSLGAQTSLLVEGGYDRPCTKEKNVDRYKTRANARNCQWARNTDTPRKLKRWMLINNMVARSYWTCRTVVDERGVWCVVLILSSCITKLAARVF